MPRFFVKPENILSDSIIIDGDDVKHIKNVLRLRCNDIITLCDGMGTDFTARIEKFESNLIYADIIDRRENTTEPPIEVALFQGIPKSDKMDLIIQKSVELGVTRIVPVITDRTVVVLRTEKDKASKTNRWQRIAMEAAKQSNRGIIPIVDLPLDFNKALESAKEMQLGIIPYEKENEKSLKVVLKDFSAKSIAVFIGPEGGFSQDEIDEAISAGMKPVSLGPRILRTETAGIAVLSVVMYEFGGFDCLNEERGSKTK
ncbi:MAG TPA: 16S rRNA (uracil(1498)-N(3))-methyltransferase [Clostridiaceae bacterium]|nr:16S rRNA (uracil(1498)-N(3))-methyltransferase [Clostridiaceae bacterium]